MHDAPIRFVRVRLFLAYSLIAWYSLFNPERTLLMLKDFDEAEAKRTVKAAHDRIFSHRRIAKKS